MDKSVEQQASGASQGMSKPKPVAKWAQGVTKWAKTFFTLTEEERDAAGISDYKDDRI